jgi:hypothetical protein
MYNNGFKNVLLKVKYICMTCGKWFKVQGARFKAAVISYLKRQARWVEGFR